MVLENNENHLADEIGKVKDRSSSKQIISINIIQQQIFYHIFVIIYNKVGQTHL